MRFAKKIAAIGLALALTSLAGCTQKQKFSQKETKYYVAYSHVLNKNGEFCGIDEDGNYTSASKVNLQDGSKIEFANGKKIIGGSRANTHLVVNNDGSYEEFHLLDSSDYTGVCAITMNDDRIVASMNGGYSDGVYVNDLVVQKLSGEVEMEQVIEIFARDIICTDETIYIVGSMDRAGESENKTGKIIAYNLTTGEMSEQLYESKKVIESAWVLNENLYCSVRNINGGTREVYVIDTKTLNRTETFEFSGEVEGLLNYEDKLYSGIGNEFCLISSEDGEVLDKLYTLPQGSFITDTAAFNGHIYITTRFNNPDKEKSVFGTQIDYDLSDKTYTQTPIHMDFNKYSHFVVCAATNK